MNQEQFEKMKNGKGFIAALDQSGGSTPKALKDYGIEENQYSNEDEMYTLVHEMRTRIITSPAFSSEKILGAILFEQTMDREVEGKYTSDYLADKGIVPFLKVDKGLADEENGVQLMKVIPGLDELLKVGRSLSNQYASMMPYLYVGVIYLALTGIVTIVLNQIEKRIDY